MRHIVVQTQITNISKITMRRNKSYQTMHINGGVNHTTDSQTSVLYQPKGINATTTAHPRKNLTKVNRHIRKYILCLTRHITSPTITMYGQHNLQPSASLTSEKFPDILTAWHNFYVQASLYRFGYIYTVTYIVPYPYANHYLVQYIHVCSYIDRHLHISIHSSIHPSIYPTTINYKPKSSLGSKQFAFICGFAATWTSIRQTFAANEMKMKFVSRPTLSSGFSYP